MESVQAQQQHDNADPLKAAVQSLGDAVTQEIADAATQPHTDLPDAAQTQAQQEIQHELAVVYLPAKMHFMLMRGQQTIGISAVEMAGIMQMSAFLNPQQINIP